MASFPWSRYRKECSAEFVGTYLLVLFGAGSVIISASISGTIALVFVACVFGGTVALVVLLLGRHSGAHINPAVTLAHAFAKKTRSDLILPYVTFQALGAILAAFTLRLFFLNRSVMPADLGSTELAVGVTPIYGVFLEAIGTFLLCSAALVATFYVRQSGRQAALMGGTLFLLILLLGHLTGASFNPARSIGPALSSGHWSNIIVYLLGPFLGAAFAAVPFRLLHIEDQIRELYVVPIRDTVSAVSMKSISADMPISVAKRDELPEILALLEECELPKEGLATHLSTTLVARKGREIVGCSALELYQEFALLRSVAVKPSFRKRGLALKLTRAALDLAKRYQVTNVYLLTETASTFFSKVGFARVLRSDVPENIQRSAEFTTLCPDTATVMTMNITAGTHR